MNEKNNNGKKGKWKAIAAIVVAALGLAGTAIGSWAKVRVGENTAELLRTIDHLDSSVADLQKRTDNLLADNKRLAEVGLALRDRVSKLEGILEGRSMIAEWVRRKHEPEEVKLDKVLTRAKPARIQPLRAQQMAE